MELQKSHPTGEGNTEAANNPISQDEIALYDRQIRLWGLGAQEKIRGAKILILNARALANEVAKNLVLAGVGYLTLLDPAEVTEEDLGAQFLLADPGPTTNPSPVGRNRAETACANLRRLNPRVRIVADAEALSAKDASFFQPFDVIIATDMDADVNGLQTINATTRKNNQAFYVASTHGLFGFVFCDLIERDFVIRRVIGNVLTRLGPETRTRSVINVVESRDGTKSIETVTKRELYSPWQASSKASFSPDFAKSGRRLRAVTPALSCVRALWDFARQTDGRLPTQAAENDDRRFIALATERHAALGLRSDSLRPEFLRRFLQSLGTEVSPVAAIVGGQLAQDVINVLGQTQQPIQNTVVFDGDCMDAFVYTLHPEGPLGQSST